MNYFVFLYLGDFFLSLSHLSLFVFLSFYIYPSASVFLHCLSKYVFLQLSFYCYFVDSFSLFFWCLQNFVLNAKKYLLQNWLILNENKFIIALSSIRVFKRLLWNTLNVLINLWHTVCPRSSYPFYVVSYYINGFTTSWTHSNYIKYIFP